TYGFRYILARPSLLGLQLVFFCVNFVGSLGFTIMAAMVLARSGSDATALGTVQAAAGVGGVCGGLLLSLWGGPKKRVHGVLLGMVGVSLLGQMMMGVGRSTFVWAAASFMLMLIMPILNGSNQAIWQAKVPPDVQGRVFSVRRMIAQISAPLATLLAGPLADKVFEPAMQPGGSLSGLFGGLIGTGPGAGMGLLMFLSGALGVCVGLGGYAFRAVREAETLVPDHDQAAGPEAAPAPVQPLVGELATAE
ncbi:MAG TPA: MFS transporter, partial [Herpetosiphonaceae bacterium]